MVETAGIELASANPPKTKNLLINQSGDFQLFYLKCNLRTTLFDFYVHIHW